MSPRIFVNPSGQRDNLGDSVLRRGYLDALRAHGELHVHVGAHHEYATALGLTGDDVVYVSKRDWFRAAWRRVPGQPLVFAMNAGEIVLDRQFVFKALWHRALVERSRLQGGSSLAWGIAVRPNPMIARWALASLLKNLSHVSWRDQFSRDIFRRGESAPDWAFALGQSDSRLNENRTLPRGYIAVSLRGDRPGPSAQWIHTVRTLAEENDAEIVAVVQVGRDAVRAQELADALGGRVLDWTTGSHADQEVRVRALYAETLAVISDRIHALIIGVTEGAIPIGYTPASVEKVERTFAELTALPIAFSDTDTETAEESLDRARNLLRSNDILLADLREGRIRLSRMASSID